MLYSFCNRSISDGLKQIMEFFITLAGEVLEDLLDYRGGGTKRGERVIIKVQKLVDY